MLKGRTKIKLFDAKSGKLEKEVIEENLVTNAVSNVINAPIEMRMMNSFNWTNDILTKNLPLYKNAYGGLLCFKNAHILNANTCVPDDSNEITAFAGTDPADVDARQGEFNEIESVPITNGYRFVWEFNTSQGNGLISSISLSSVQAGNSGANLLPDKAINITNKLDGTADSYDVYYRKMLNDFSNLKVDLNISDINGSICYVSAVVNGEYFIIYYDAEENRIYKAFYKSATNRRLTAPDLNNFVRYEVLSNDIATNGVFTTNYGNWNCWVDENNKLNVIDQDENSIYANHHIYALDGTLEDSIVVTTPYALELHGIGYYNGKYIGISKQNGVSYWKECPIFTDDGIVVDTFYLENGDWGNNTPNLIGYGINQNSGEGYFIIKAGAAFDQWVYGARIGAEIKIPSKIFRNYDTTYYENIDFATLPKTAMVIQSPWHMLATSNPIARLLLFGQADYLATINNLENPVTKTSAQNMKIIYELTEI